MSPKDTPVGIIIPQPPDEDEKLRNLLDELQPAHSKRRNERFIKAYPSIVLAKARDVSTKDILDTLERGGLKLHPQKFREMMKEEEKRRAEHGDSVCCAHCGQALSVSQAADSSHAGKENHG